MDHQFNQIVPLLCIGHFIHFADSVCFKNKAVVGFQPINMIEPDE